MIRHIVDKLVKKNITFITAVNKMWGMTWSAIVLLVATAYESSTLLSISLGGAETYNHLCPQSGNKNLFPSSSAIFTFAKQGKLMIHPD